MTAWVRHGQSTWNAAGRLQGGTPHPPLTALGRRQAARAAELLAASPPVRCVFSSPAIRAHQTADILGSMLAVPVVLSPLITEQGLDEPEQRVRERLLEFVTTERVDTTVVVSHGDTIRLAAQLLTGGACPVPDNGAVVNLPSTPADTVRS